MMFDKFNLALLRYLLGLQLLSGWCPAQMAVTVEPVDTVCVGNLTTSPKVNISCGSLNRIEVVSIYYGYRRASSECTQSSAINTCGKLFKTGHQLGNLLPYQFCSGNKQDCLVDVGTFPAVNCSPTNVISNFVLVEYRCVPETDFIDLCGDDDEDIDATKHLAYFGSFSDNQSRNCTCVIQGQHNLTAVRVGISTLPLCNSTNLRMSLIHTDSTTNNKHLSQASEHLINVDFKELNSSHIRLLEDCLFQSPPVWFKVNPAKGETVRIQCGESINKPSSASSPKPSSPRATTTTTTTDFTFEVTQLNTTEVTNHNTNSTVATTSLSNTTEKPKLAPSTEQRNIAIPVIVGSVIGALVLILILIAIGVLVYRRKRREKSPSGLGTVVNNTYNFDEVNAGNHQTFPNNAFEESSPDYSSVGETKTSNDNNDRFMSGESSTDYDLLKPATVLKTFSYQNKKATGEQHDDVTLYDHPKKQTKGGHHILPGDDVKDSDYDVLESKPNLNSSFDKVDTLNDDTYNHIGGNHKEPSDTTDQVMPKTETKTVVESAPEYATVNKHGAGQEQTGSAAGDGNNAKLDSTGNAKDTNIYHILEEPTTQEIQTGSDN